MRPSLLDPLFAPVSTLPNVGERVSKMIAKVAGTDSASGEPRVADLLFIMPHSVIDRRFRPEIAAAPEGSIVTLEVTVDRHQPPPRGRSNVPYRVFCFDETGQIELVFFRAKAIWLEKTLPVGEEVIVSGEMSWFNGRPNMVHPDYMTLASEAASLPQIETVYPLTAGLSLKVLRKAISAALERLPELPEWLDADYASQNRLPGFSSALYSVHHPAVPEDVDPAHAAYHRLAFDELLAGQLALGLVRRNVKRLAGRPLTGDGSKVAAIRSALPYKLTGSQSRAVGEISKDLAKPDRMLRLLQGDVGSGKTVVALLAMAQACEAGVQSALMVPTEILARQHLATIEPFAEAAGVKTVLLTGKARGAERKAALAAIEDGSADIVIGTHALFQEKVAFRNLGLVVVDEQHRFGVHQRLALSAKNTAPDMLVMTATPIPRTLVLTAFGDMDVSRLEEKPAGRKPIHTVAMPRERMDELVARIGTAIREGKKAYWICPLVEESELVDLTSAEDRHGDLAKHFGSQVGLIHGRMTATEKEAAMLAFRDGQTRLLVATTVIEVGVDVPDASIMVIEHAERFGLAQLHQLRGRVGRGDEASSCILLYQAPLGETARARLAIMRETEDGFRIAEEDLRLRGEGDVLGTKQSGMPGFRIARMENHSDLIAAARDDARLLLERDPNLQSERGQALRHLLYLFGRDEAVRLLRAG